MIFVFLENWSELRELKTTNGFWKSVNIESKNCCYRTVIYIDIVNLNYQSQKHGMFRAQEIINKFNNYTEF
ncbi:Protein of unknown function [Gryllus bimaculatus]|nr:Protein of unknown function [Gryllus bimaculatus]